MAFCLVDAEIVSQPPLFVQVDLTISSILYGGIKRGNKIRKDRINVVESG